MMYFVHSYYVDTQSNKLILTKTSYDDFVFCSSVSMNNIYAFQFHPEKSGQTGLEIYKNFKDIIISNAQN